MDLINVLTQYDKLESELLYNKAVDLFNLITDSELEELLKSSPENSTLLKLGNKPTDEIKRNKELLKDAIDLFISTIESRNLTQEEFDSMTLDEIKNYISNTITDKTSVLLGVINRLEDIYKS
jgi:hypothetical protein